VTWRLRRRGPSCRALRIAIAAADYSSVSGSETIEGSLKISAAVDGYVAAFTPYAVEHWPPGQPLRLASREAAASFLHEIGTRPRRIVEILDDLRDTGGVFLPMVVVTPGQRQAFRL
jgi:hypothetical protein